MAPSADGDWLTVDLAHGDFRYRNTVISEVRRSSGPEITENGHSELSMMHQPCNRHSAALLRVTYNNS